MNIKTVDLVDFNLLRPAEVSRILSISKSKVYRLISSGELPSVEVGYSKRVHPSDLVHYIDNARTIKVPEID